MSARAKYGASFGHPAAEPARAVEAVAPKPRLYGASYVDGIFCMWVKGGPWARTIHGIASRETVDEHNQVLVSVGMQAKFPIPLRFGHAKHGDPIGSVVFIRRRPKEIYVRAIIDQSVAGDHAWKLIESGEVRAFSVGPGNDVGAMQEVDGRRFYRAWRLAELSICRSGACPDCVFEIYS